MIPLGELLTINICLVFLFPLSKYGVIPHRLLLTELRKVNIALHYAFFPARPSLVTVEQSTCTVYVSLFD